MNRTELLIGRLNDIGEALAKRSSALALIALGSVGIQRDRLDQYSDLDFFVIVKSGCKRNYLDDLSWLKDVSPVGYYFMNTQDGYKLMFKDGVFCEFAVFDEFELQSAVFTPGRIIWKADGVSDSISSPQKPIEDHPAHSAEWLIGEALTNLYVGLCRDRRGEKLSAARFIQGYAVDRVLELMEETESVTPVSRDEFNIERRFEQRCPMSSKVLPDMMQGYEKNRESAMSILSYLDEHYTINPVMKQVVLDLCHSPAGRD